MSLANGAPPPLPQPVAGVEVPQRSIGWLIVLIVLWIGSVLTLPIWLIMAMLSFMAFDAGFSVWAAAFVTAMWGYPVWLLAWNAGAIWAFRTHRNLGAVLASVIGVMPFMALLLVVMTN